MMYGEGHAAALNEVVKTQRIRMIDVWVLGPLMLYAAHLLPKRHELTRVALAGTGIATIAFNWRNYNRIEDAQSGYGHVTLRHFRKVHPWLTRLEQATEGLRQDMTNGNKMETLRSLEDVWFWVGRTIGEVLASHDMLGQNPKLAKRAQTAMTDAAIASSQANAYLGSE